MQAWKNHIRKVLAERAPSEGPRSTRAVKDSPSGREVQGQAMIPMLPSRQYLLLHQPSLTSVGLTLVPSGRITSYCTPLSTELD